MCRFLAYSGQPAFMSDLIYAPARSLVHQSLHAAEAKTETNGDGFGLGWYGSRSEPGLYREIRPAWSDENLRSLCHQVQASMFFAHVRASTGTASTRANCHPFAHESFLFMHNGQIGGYDAIRRRVEELIPDDLYRHRHGTGDSEAIFLAALGRGLGHRPLHALAETIAAIRALMKAAAIDEPLRFTAALADGDRLWAVRWSSDRVAPTLYYRALPEAVVVVSEPYDDRSLGWCEVPKNAALAVENGQLTVLPFGEFVGDCKMSVPS